MVTRNVLQFFPLPEGTTLMIGPLDGERFSPEFYQVAGWALVQIVETGLCEVDGIVLTDEGPVPARSLHEGETLERLYIDDREVEGFIERELEMSDAMYSA